IYVGKQGGGQSADQEEIERLLLEHGSAGTTVVRLKGGDPFVFGRGGEEGEALAAAGVRFEVVPGVTAGVAAPAYAGIPVTHRDDASAVAFVTGHEDPDKDESALDWEALARFPGTLVLYMGVKRLAENAAALTGAGRSPEEPAAVIERGTMAGQRVVNATLGTIAEAAARLLCEALAGARLDARALAQATVAAIGPGTAAALRQHGIEPDVVPERSVAEALVEALAEVEVSGRPVLVARAAEAREVLPDA